MNGAEMNLASLCQRIVKQHDAHMQDIAAADKAECERAARLDDLEGRIHEFERLQRQFDSEGATILSGSRSFIPERPDGEPRLWVGIALTTAIPVIAGVLVWMWQ